ncbi:hypothetical protein [Phaeodactylibacter xiamenensis]|uniref:hypothetical protein n=1 Tax=Phaeodactylibacter xiamenensis TaxID=1524460 RepID=UPI0024A7C09E|nr:hypothetical protein [Phaeodactylibacter xiamenensis]
MEIEAHLYLLSMLEKKQQDNPAFDDMFGRVDELIEKKLAFIKKNNDGVLKFLYALDHVLAKEFSNGEV